MKRISADQRIACEDALKDVSRRLDLIDEGMARVLDQLGALLQESEEGGDGEGNRRSEKEQTKNLRTTDLELLPRRR
jgi:hypothetical protein